MTEKDWKQEIRTERRELSEQINGKCQKCFEARESGKSDTCQKHWELHWFIMGKEEALNLAEEHFKDISERNIELIFENSKLRTEVEKWQLENEVSIGKIKQLEAENDRLARQIPGTGENLTSVQLRHQVDKLKAENNKLVSRLTEQVQENEKLKGKLP